MIHKITPHREHNSECQLMPPSWAETTLSYHLYQGHTDPQLPPVPRTQTQRTFSVGSATTWNSLPCNMCTYCTLPTFKTYLFRPEATIASVLSDFRALYKCCVIIITILLLLLSGCIQIRHFYHTLFKGFFSGHGVPLLLPLPLPLLSCIA